jgi:hypothetical protein
VYAEPGVAGSRRVLLTLIGRPHYPSPIAATAPGSRTAGLAGVNDLDVARALGKVTALIQYAERHVRLAGDLKDAVDALVVAVPVLLEAAR